MEHKTIHLQNELSDSYIHELVTKHVKPNDRDFDAKLLVDDYCTVLKPNGDVLLKFLPGAMNFDYATAAFNAFESANLETSKSSQRPAIVASGNPGSTAVLGFMARVHRFNYCRATALTAKHLEGFKASIPFIRSASELMKQHMPERYAAQLGACNQCKPDYIIPGTVFSTTTINRNVTATYHTDEGDFKAGIGVIAATWAKRKGRSWQVVTENPAEGGILVFPKYGVSVMLRSTDLVLADVHTVHGVTPITGKPGSWARMSFVFYLRERMSECGSPAEEIERISRKDTEAYSEKRANITEADEGDA